MAENPTTPAGFPFELSAPRDHTLEAWRDWFERFAPRTAFGPHGISLVSVDDDQLTLAMEVGDHARQPYGLLHGGMSLLLAESAASMHACWKVDLTQRVPVGIELNASHLESMLDGRVLAVARQIRRSRRLAHHEIEIREAPDGRLLSIARMTNFYRPTGRPPGRSG